MCNWMYIYTFLYSTSEYIVNELYVNEIFFLNESPYENKAWISISLDWGTTLRLWVITPSTLKIQAS